MTWMAVVQDAISRHRSERPAGQWHDNLLATRCLQLHLRHIAALRRHGVRVPCPEQGALW